jgi:hypothetical protein
MTSATELIQSLSPAQQRAIQIIKLSLDCFNSAEGEGLFTGTTRYAALAGRVEICAAQARDLAQFWALLLRRMQWPVPPRAADQAIVNAISGTEPRAVLRVLATETASVITLARMVHDQDKGAKRAMRDTATDTFDDSLESIA